MRAAAPATCGVAIDVPAMSVRQSGMPFVDAKSGPQLPVKFVSPALLMNGVDVQMFSIQWRSSAVPESSLFEGSPPGATIPHAPELCTASLGLPHCEYWATYSTIFVDDAAVVRVDV